VTGTPSQLVLDLEHHPALEAEDFLVSRSNRAAADFIARWPDWPHASAVVVAPARAGKTHLANVWRRKCGAARLEAKRICEADAACLSGPVLIEDLHAGIGEERVLFHLLNLARERRLSMLITSRRPPGELSVALPDLRSRLRALPIVAIEPPDEALLKAVLVKHFADRQLAVEPHVIGYIALHMEQSMEAAASVVRKIDAAALSARRRVTRALVHEVLAEHAAAEQALGGQALAQQHPEPVEALLDARPEEHARPRAQLMQRPHQSLQPVPQIGRPKPGASRNH
jgi:chromosomal replication initiation ATPase DnaA